MKKLLWAPGYIIIAMLYFFPIEWGKRRNVAKSSRWWKYKDNLAPFISAVFYFYILLSLLPPSSHDAPIKSQITEKLK